MSSFEWGVTLGTLLGVIATGVCCYIHYTSRIDNLKKQIATLRAKLSQSAKPAQSAKPSQPAKPVQPAIPSQPAKPVQSAIPSQPVKSAQSEKPVQPTKPVLYQQGGRVIHALSMDYKYWKNEFYISQNIIEEFEIDQKRKEAYLYSMEDYYKEQLESARNMYPRTLKRLAITFSAVMRTIVLSAVR